MRRGLVVALLMLVLGARGTSVHAQGSLTIVAPAAPGGGWDQTARAMQQVLAALEPDAHVQVENVAGAAGTIGLARFVTGERGNPNALMVTGLVMVSGITTNRAPVRLAATTPIARLTGEFEVIVVPAASPIRTLADLLAAFQARPESVSWGGGSAGGTDDLLVRLVAEAVGVAPARANYIAFAGGGAALAALLGGQVTAGVSGYGEFAGQIAAGTLRLLAVSSPSRVAGIDAPTLREQGVALDLANWRGLVAPPGLTDVERDALIARVERMVTSEAWRAVLTRNGWADMLMTGPAFRQFLLAEQQRVDAVLLRLDSATEAGELQSRDVTSTTGVWVTPTTAPRVALLICAVLVVGNLIVGRTAIEPLAHRTRAMALIAALAAHAIAFPFIGFIPAGTALFVVTATLFGSRRTLRDAAIGLTTSAVLYVVFTAGLGLSLPVDPITHWLYE